MKIFTYECFEEEVTEKKQWLTDVVGVKPFRVTDFRDKKLILFVVQDQEQETMLSLKYPHGTFHHRSA